MNTTKRKDIIGFLISLAILILVNAIGSISFFRIDLTSENRYSISEPTQKLLKSLDEDLLVRVYLQGEDLPATMLRLRNETREILNEFRAYSNGNLDFEFINPSAHPDKKERERIYKNLYEKGLRPTDLQIKSEDGMAQRMVWPGAIITYQGKEMTVQLLKSQFGAPPQVILNQSIESLEFALASTIKTISTDELKSIAFIEGHGELNKFESADIIGSLRDYYHVERVEVNGDINSLAHRVAVGKDSTNMLVKNKFDAIVIAGPDTAFAEKDKFIIDQFAMYGGKVVWLIDQVRASMDSLRRGGFTMGMSKSLNLDDQLFHYGVRINYDLVQDLRAAPIPVVTGQYGNQANSKLFPWLFYPLIVSPNDHPINKNIDVVRAQFANSIDLVGDKSLQKTVILSTSENTKLVKAPTRISLNMVSFDPPKDQFTKKNVPIAVLVEGEFTSTFDNRLPPNITNASEIKYINKSPKTQMLFISDADLIRNRYNPRSNEYYALGFDQYTKQVYGNKDFFINAMHYLLDDSGIIVSNTKSFKIRLLNSELIEHNRLLIQIINTALPIALVIIIGFILNFIRKKKYTVKR